MVEVFRSRCEHGGVTSLFSEVGWYRRDPEPHAFASDWFWVSGNFASCVARRYGRSRVRLELAWIHKVGVSLERVVASLVGTQVFGPASRIIASQHGLLSSILSAEYGNFQSPRTLSSFISPHPAASVCRCPQLLTVLTRVLSGSDESLYK